MTSEAKLDWNRFREGTAGHIERNGRSIIRVFTTDEDDGFPFAYTVGNHIRKLPELLVIGTSRAPFLNDLSQMMIDIGRPFLNGQLVRIGIARLMVKLVRASDAAREEYTVQAGEYFGHQNYEVMQVVLPDRTGKFPDEPGCQPPWSTFPVLHAD
jgi:Domain of unknown function (DUF4262)